MVDQEKIHNQCISSDPKERIHSLEVLKNFFSLMPDKEQAWNDLHILTNDEYNSVRFRASKALGLAYPHVLDKQQAVNDLIKLTNDKDSSVRSSAAEALGSAFSQVPDKQQAWNDLIKLTSDEYSYVRSSAAYALGSAFSQVPDKQQAFNDLHRLTSNEDRYVRSSAAEILGLVYPHVLDKKQAVNDLIKLINDKSSYVRYRAIDALALAYPHVPDKHQAWNDLIKLTSDEDRYVRSNATEALGLAYPHVLDKKQAVNDLIKLTNYKSSYVRSSAAEALGSAFSQVPDKKQAFNDLHKLTRDKEWIVRSSAAYALGSAFSQVPDKKQALEDLYRLTNDEYSSVRSWAAYALGSAFSQVLDKKQAWNELIRLTNDKESYVRTSSNHSLGRVSIFMASQAETEENYKKELEKAIEFFETAAKEAAYFNRGIFWEASYSNPAQFCLPFYRTFHTIIFKKPEAKEEVNKYLEEAKAAIKGSESKKQLFEAVQNLAEALKEVQNMGTLDLSGMKNELNFYRKYCDHAAELMKHTYEKAPFATEVLRKGLPILDRNIKRILEEIQEKAKIACKVSQGTATKEIACAVSREVQKWEIGGSQEEVARKVEDIAYILKIKVADLPENEYFLNKIEAIRHEVNLIKQLEILSCLIGLIPTVKVVPEDVVMKNINKMGKNIETKLESLSQEMNDIRIGLSPSIKQEIEISSGIEISGTGAKLITTIPLKEISYAELKEDLQRIKGENISKLSELPKRLANKIKGYLLLKGREDIIEQLT